MSDRRGPVRGQGKRRLFCPYYSGCLDIAAKGNWESFNCQKCPQYYSLSRQYTNSNGGGMMGKMEEAAAIAEKKAVCRVEGCGEAVKCRGFCLRHYDKWRTGSLIG